jgi:pimeloyl-ACP methyl ester carboxylesterase
VWWVGVALAAVVCGCGSGDEPAGRQPASGARGSGAAPGIEDCARAPAGIRATAIPSAGGVLTAAVLGRGPTAVIFANTGGSGPCPWLPLARRLVRRGVRAVVFEYGEGTPAAEVAAAARWARRAGARRVALVGAGSGARAVVLAAVRHPELIAAVVSLSAEQLQNGRDDLVPHVRRLRRPVLWIGSREDNLTNWGRDTRELSRATRSRHELILVRDGWAIELLSGAPAARVIPALERFVLGA